MNKRILAIVLVFAMALALVVSAHVGYWCGSSKNEERITELTEENERVTDYLYEVAGDWWWDADKRHVMEQFARELEIIPCDEWFEGSPVTMNRDGRMAVVKQVVTVSDAETGAAYDDDGCYACVHMPNLENGDVVTVYALADPGTEWFDDFCSVFYFTDEEEGAYHD